jgi:hypothetical protein
MSYNLYQLAHVESFVALYTSGGVTASMHAYFNVASVQAGAWSRAKMYLMIPVSHIMSYMH